VIEDRADIGCGVAVLGAVRVGHDSVIGANAVVLDDVPPHSVAVGLPARVVKSLGPPRDMDRGSVSPAGCTLCSSRELNGEPAGRIERVE
jgi:serine acetyltransferase